MNTVIDFNMLAIRLAALPSDLSRTILEFAATEDRKSATSFVLVSKLVKEWIDPILYRTVYVQSDRDASSIQHAIMSRGSFDFFTRHVKVLVYAQSFSDSHMSTILSATPSLTALIYNAHQRWDPPEIQQFLDNSPHLRRLHITSVRSFPWHIHHLNVTHFSIEMWSSIPRLRECLPLLPSLTHLSLSMVSIWDLPYLWQFARALPQALSVFLVQFTRFLVYDPQDGPHDPRVVCVSLKPDYEPYVTGQSTEGIMRIKGVYVDTEPLEGQEDAWSLAERIIQDRHAVRDSPFNALVECGN